MISETQAPATSFSSKPRRIGRAPSGLRKDFQRCFGYHAELAFGATHHAEQIKTAAIKPGAADLDDFTIHHHHGDAQQIVGGHAIFEAMGAAGIHGNIAGYRTGQLA